MKREVITIEQVRQLAEENYCNGGDVICECYTDEMIQERINGNKEEYLKPMKSKTSWMKLFKFYKDLQVEEEHMFDY